MADDGGHESEARRVSKREGGACCTHTKRASLTSTPFRVLVIGRTIEQERAYGWRSSSTFRDRFASVGVHQPIEVTLLDPTNPVVAEQHDLPEVRTVVTSVAGSFPFDFHTEHKFDIIMNDWSTLNLCERGVWQLGYTPAALRRVIAPTGQLLLRDVHTDFDRRRVMVNTRYDRRIEAATRCVHWSTDAVFNVPVVVLVHPREPAQVWYVNLDITTVSDFFITAVIVPVLTLRGVHTHQIPERVQNNLYGLKMMVDETSVSTNDVLDMPLRSIGVVRDSVISFVVEIILGFYFNDMDDALVHEGFYHGVLVEGEYMDEYPLLRPAGDGSPCPRYGVWFPNDGMGYNKETLWANKRLALPGASLRLVF